MGIDNIYLIQERIFHIRVGVVFCSEFELVLADNTLIKCDEIYFFVDMVDAEHISIWCAPIKLR